MFALTACDVMRHKMFMITFLALDDAQMLSSL